MPINNFTNGTEPNYFGNRPYYVPNIPQQQSNSGVIWVQGEAAARSYPVAPMNTVILWDSDADVFYKKSTDQQGRPQEMEIFTYSKKPSEAVVAQTSSQEEIKALRTEIDTLKSKVDVLINGRKEDSNVKSNVQRI